MTADFRQPNVGKFIFCPHCGTQFQVPEVLMGGIVYCVACGHRFQTPVIPVAPIPEIPAASPDHEEIQHEISPSSEETWSGRPSRWRQVKLYILFAFLTTAGILLTVWKIPTGRILTDEIVWVVPAFGAILITLGILTLFTAEIRRIQKYYVIGEKEIAASEGLLNIQLNRILIRDIRSLNLRARLWDRIVGICDIDIGTAGTSGVEIQLTAIPRKVGERLHRTRNS